MSKKEQLVESLSALSVLEMAELKTALEEKWGVKAAASAAPAAAAAAAPAAAVSESTEFEISIAEKVADDKKIGIIKVVREITGLGLKEAKELVEAAPKVVKASAAKAEAEEIKKKLEAASAKVTVRGL